jgi:hypothetical protein
MLLMERRSSLGIAKIVTQLLQKLYVSLHLMRQSRFFWGSSFAELQSATHEPKACVFHFSSSSSSSSSGYPMLKTTRMAMPSDNGRVQGYM